MSDWTQDERDQLIAAIRTPIPLSMWAAGQIADVVIISGVHPPSDDRLAALRAEVMALRDAIDARYGEFMFRDKDAGAHDAYAAVLGLIDKHSQEGQ